MRVGVSVLYGRRRGCFSEVHQASLLYYIILYYIISPPLIPCQSQNGFRYSSPRTQEVVDVMFSNVKHAFFQPAQNEHIALVHLHLFDPIMVNKKKTNDVQFFTEVGMVIMVSIVTGSY